MANSVHLEQLKIVLKFWQADVGVCVTRFVGLFYKPLANLHPLEQSTTGLRRSLKL